MLKALCGRFLPRRKIALDILGASATERDVQAEHTLREMLYR